MELPQIQILSKTDLAKPMIREMVRWTKDSDRLRGGALQAEVGLGVLFYSQLFRSLKKSSLALGLFPVSSYTREGFVPLIGEFARIFGGGEEYEE